MAVQQHVEEVRGVDVVGVPRVDAEGDVARRVLRHRRVAHGLAQVELDADPDFLQLLLDDGEQTRAGLRGPAVELGREAVGVTRFAQQPAGARRVRTLVVAQPGGTRHPGREELPRHHTLPRVDLEERAPVERPRYGLAHPHVIERPPAHVHEQVLGVEAVRHLDLVLPKRVAPQAREVRGRDLEESALGEPLFDQRHGVRGGHSEPELEGVEPGRSAAVVGIAHQ